MPKVTQPVRGRAVNLAQADLKPSVLSTASCCYRGSACFVSVFRAESYRDLRVKISQSENLIACSGASNRKQHYQINFWSNPE